MESIITNIQGGNHEVDHPQEQPDDHVVGPGVGARSYECVFCRRGFTTAQALGGHMNIHRKDRAKSRSGYHFSNNNNNNNNSNKQYANPPAGLYNHPVFTAGCESTCNNDQEGNVGFATYENNYQQDCDHHVVSYSPSREEKMMSLRLKFGWSHGEDDRESTIRRTRGESNNEDDDDQLDLELRLGHDP